MHSVGCCPMARCDVVYTNIIPVILRPPDNYQIRRLYKSNSDYLQVLKTSKVYDVMNLIKQGFKINRSISHVILYT